MISPVQSTSWQRRATKKRGWQLANNVDSPKNPLYHEYNKLRQYKVQIYNKKKSYKKQYENTVLIENNVWIALI